MHHIDVHVSDTARARALFDAIVPHIGLTLRRSGDDFTSYWRGGKRPSIGLIADGAVAGSGTVRLAFAVGERDAVDAAARAALEHGARCIEGPALHPEYGDDYYAVFFEDEDGNKFEIVCDPDFA